MLLINYGGPAWRWSTPRKQSRPTCSPAFHERLNPAAFDPRGTGTTTQAPEAVGFIAAEASAVAGVAVVSVARLVGSEYA